MVNVCRCFSSNFVNQLETSDVFFHSLSFSFSYKQILVLPNISLLILPILFLAGFISIAVGWVKKFYLWSFKVIKQLLGPLISILSNLLARCALYPFFVYNTLDSLRSSFICWIYCIVQGVIVLIFCWFIHIWDFFCWHKRFVWQFYYFQVFI